MEAADRWRILPRARGNRLKPASVRASSRSALRARWSSASRSLSNSNPAFFAGFTRRGASLPASFSYFFPSPTYAPIHRPLACPDVIPAAASAYVRMRAILSLLSPMARPSTMNFSEAVAIATSSLWAHKLRSVLTLIGVVIGVAAVIAVVSLINGANQYVATKVFNLGADVFGVSKQPSIVTNVDDWIEFQKRKKLDWDDYQAIKDECKSCKEIGASMGGRVEVRSGLNSLKDTNLRAWTSQMPEL